MLSFEGKFQPVCLHRQLLIPPNPTRYDAVAVCLWTKRDVALQQLTNISITPAAVGNLYSGKRGIDPLIRNLLANPHITCIMVTGQNLSGSREALLGFMNSRPNDVSFYQGAYGLGSDITLAEVESIQRSITIVDVSTELHTTVYAPGQNERVNGRCQSIKHIAVANTVAKRAPGPYVLVS